MKRNRLTSFIELGRPWNSLSVILLSILGFILSVPATINFSLILLLAVIVFLIYNGSSALNDLFDIKVDSVNMPFRPLERGSIRERGVITFCLVCYLLGNIIALSISLNFFLSILLMSLSSIIYSTPPISLKDRLFLGNLGLGFVSAFTTIYAGFVLSTNNLIIPYELLIQSISLMLLFSFFSLLKDFKDRSGDGLHNKKTITTKYGIKNASKINIVGTVIFFPITMLAFYLLSFQNMIFILVSSIIFISLLILELKVYRDPTQKTGEMSWSFGRLAFLFFLLSLFLF